MKRFGKTLIWIRLIKHKYGCLYISFKRASSYLKSNQETKYGSAADLKLS